MLKYWRIWLLILFVSASALAIGFKVYPYGRHVVEISFVSDASPAKGVLEQGMLISAVNGIPLDNVNDWNNLTQGIVNKSVTLTANGKDYRFSVNDTLGIDVMDIDRTNLEFGLDLRGGTRIILKPASANATKEDITQTIATLQTRANLYGLKEMRLCDHGCGRLKLHTDRGGWGEQGHRGEPALQAGSLRGEGSEACGPG